MIKNNTPLSMAESLEYVEKDSEVSQFIKNFTKLNPKESKEFRKKLESLDLMKLKSSQIVKIIDVMPEDKEDLNKIFIGMSLDEDDDGNLFLVVAADADTKEIKSYIKDAKPPKEIKKLLDDSLKGVKARKPTAEETSDGRDWMCKNYYDIRTFGAVMSLKSAPNCGQVRGPVQLTFARSIEPIVASEHSITRMAVATEAEATKQSGDNRTMGRKFTIPYGLYMAHGFVSAHLAEQTGFSDDDMDLFLEAITNMFEHDRSAARGEMITRGLYVFKHESKLGNAQAHSLFERVQINRTNDGAARAFSDYTVTVNDQDMPSGVSLMKVVG